MKKFTAIAAVLAMSNMAQAAGDATEYKWDAEVRTRFFSDNNLGRGTQLPPATAPNGAKSAQSNAWQQRNVVGMTMTKGESLTGRIRLINSMQWGSLGRFANTTTTNPAGTTSVNTNDGTAQPTQDNANNLLYVNEAWLGWAINPNVMMKAGRMSLATIADGSVLSTNDWLANPYASDGVKFVFDYDFGRIGLMGVKAADSGAAASPLTSDGETNFYGISFDVKNLPEWLKIANLHVIQQNKDVQSTALLAGATGIDGLLTGITSSNSNFTGAGLNVMRYGITIAGDTAGFDYGVTYAGLSGKILLNKASTAGTSATNGIREKEDVSWSASMIDARAGYTFADLMKFRLGVNYHMDSGNEGDAGKDSVGVYQPFFYERHAGAGRMDLIGWGNLTYIALNASFEPMENTTVGLDYFMFSRTKNDVNSAAYTETYGSSNTFNTLGNYNQTGANRNDKSAIGTEIDLYATHTYDNGLMLTGRYGQFMAGDYLKAPGSVNVDDAQQFMLEARVQF